MYLGKKSKINVFHESIVYIYTNVNLMNLYMRVYKDEYI